MARRVFHSFHYDLDCQRIQQIRNIGVIEKNPIVTYNEWEKVWRKGESAVYQWIDGQLKGKSVVVVLIGAKTSERKYVKYEIEKGWKDGKGVVGVYIHNLKNLAGEKSSKGSNPLGKVTIDGKKLSTLAEAYDPPYSMSTNVYEHISDNLEDWIEEAVEIRKNYK